MYLHFKSWDYEGEEQAYDHKETVVKKMRNKGYDVKEDIETEPHGEIFETVFVIKIEPKPKDTSL